MASKWPQPVEGFLPDGSPCLFVHPNRLDIMLRHNYLAINIPGTTTPLQVPKSAMWCFGLKFTRYKGDAKVDWLMVKESELPKCLIVYGFTPPPEGY